MRIKKLSCFDLPKIKKMVSYLGNKANDKLLKVILCEPVSLFNYLLPLQYKFLPESYILVEGDEILGLITVELTSGNPYKVNITRLIFKEDFYDVGKQLVDFVVSKYGAKGANSFAVYVDISHDELCMLFNEGCGFRQCSYENLWKIDNFKPETNVQAKFRIAQNSDAIGISELYNSELNNLYKPSMERCSTEYVEPIFAGFNPFYKNRYVIDLNGVIIAYLSVTTADNLNYIIDLSLNDGYQFNYDEILNFVLHEITRRKKYFTAFVKHRQYAKKADHFEEYLHSRHFNCVQTQCVFVKDFYKPIKQSDSVLKVFLLGDNSILSN